MTTKLRWPFLPRTISSEYGWRVRPGSTVKSFHTGTDFQVPGGSTVRACAPGVVGQRRRDRLNGNTITVIHANGWVTKYYHLRAPSHLKAGDKVSLADVLGLVGGTGLAANGDHLHLEVWHNGVRVDPREFFALITLEQEDPR